MAPKKNAMRVTRRAELVAEAQVWRAAAEMYDRDDWWERSFFWSRVDREVFLRIDARASYHSNGEEPHNTAADAALGCLFMALECEDEAKAFREASE